MRHGGDGGHRRADLGRVRGDAAVRALRRAGGRSVGWEPGGGDAVPEAARVLRPLRQMPIVLYGAADALPAWRLVSERDDVEALVFGVDDTSRAIGAAIDRAHEGSIEKAVLGEVAQREGLPWPVGVAVPALLADARRFRGVKHLVAFCGCSRSGLYRACALAGFAMPLSLLRLGWSFYAYRLTVLQGAPFKAAAHQLGDASGRRLRGAIERVLGCSARQLRMMQIRDVVHRVGALLGRRSPESVAPISHPRRHRPRY